MVNFRIKYLTGQMYYKYRKNPLVLENIIRCEATFNFLSNAQKDRALVINNDVVTNFLMEQGLVEIVNAGNLIVSEVYDELKYDKEFILSEKDTLMRVTDDEFIEYEDVEDFTYWKYMLQKKLVKSMKIKTRIPVYAKEDHEYDDKGNEIGVKQGAKPQDYKTIIEVKTLDDIKDEPEQEVPLMDSDEWASFWDGVNKFCKENLTMTTISKKPITLHEIGGIVSNTYDRNKKRLAIVNPNNNNSWELSYILGYSNENLYNLLSNVKDRNDLLLRGYFER